MFRILRQAHSKAKFDGFDGSDLTEVGYMGFVAYLWKNGQYTDEKRPESDGGANSHMRTLARYRRMVQAWKNGKEHADYPLTAEDVARIEAAQRER